MFDRFRSGANSTKPVYHPLADSDESRDSLDEAQCWKGRKVKSQPSLERALHGPRKTTGQECQSQLREQYGAYVERKVAGNIDPAKQLDSRKVASLNGKAHSLLHDIHDKNRRQIDKWITDESKAGLVAEQFELETGYQWSSVSTQERRLMVDEVRTLLAGSREKLTREHASYIAGQYLQNHQSHFVSNCPATSELLTEMFDEGPPLLSGHFSAWAEQNHQNRVSEGLTDKDVRLVRNFQYLANNTSGLLSSSHFDDLKEADYKQQVQLVRKHGLNLVKTAKEIEAFGENLDPALKDAMIEDLKGQLQSVTRHGKQLEVNAKQDPLNNDNWRTIKRNELLAAIDVLTHEMSGLMAREESGKASVKDLLRLSAVEKMIDELDEQIVELKKGIDDDFPDTRFQVYDPDHPRDAKTFRKKVERWMSVSGIKSGQIKKRMKAARHFRMSSENWEPIVKKLEVRVAGKPYSCTSQIIPASCLQLKSGGNTEGSVDIFPKHYLNKGVPSTGTKETEHAVNLNETRMEVDGVEVYTGIRSGTLSAYGIKDKDERQLATAARAKELITAVLRQKLEENPELLDDAAKGVPVDLMFASTSMLSPDKFRHYTHIHDDELKMQAEQDQALHDLEHELKNTPLEIVDSQGRVRKIPVNLDVSTTSVGVNSVSLSGVGKLLLRPWAEAEKYNLPGLKKIMGSTAPGDKIGGWAGKFLAGKASAEDKRIVIELVEQSRDLYTTKDYRSEGDDAYKLVERLQLLNYRVGAKGHFNCKSGKDRTGEADVGIKRLATQIKVLGYVPDPRAPVTQEEKVLSQQFLMETGNLELQQKNINIQGYKTKTGKKRVGQSVFKMSHKPRFPTDTRVR